MNIQNISNTHSTATMVVREEVVVGISMDPIMSDFARAFINEYTRKNPVVGANLDVTVEELVDYINFLIQSRVAIVNDEAKNYRLLRTLCGPSFIHHVLRKVGRVEIADRGLTLIPKYNTQSKMTIDEAISISNKIMNAETVVSVVRNIMPVDEDGDRDFMTMTILKDVVYGMSVITDPVTEFLTLFLSNKIEEEYFQALYRIRYSDLSTLRSVGAAIMRDLIC